MSNAEIIKTIFLPVDAKTAWGYLTQPDKLAKWFHAPKTPLQDGEDYVLYGVDSGDKLCWGRVSHMKPYTEMTYSFSVKPAPEVETEVHWTLDELEGGTKITVRHTGLDQYGEAGFQLAMAFDAGWDRHFGELREAV